MSLYPSLEDMRVDQMLKAEGAARVPQDNQPSAPLPYPASNAQPVFPFPPSLEAQRTASTASTPTTPYPLTPNHPSSLTPNHPSSPYPQLAEFMGMELTEREIALNMPEYLPQIKNGSGQLMTAPLSAGSLGLARAQVSHGVRQVTVCKNKNGKIGVRVKSINKGVFVALVTKDSPAALAGLRFGDQLLQVNGENLAGFSSDKVHDVLKRVKGDCINLAVRDRPFERTLTLHKDSTGHIGFVFKEGEITKIAVDSSAARNGLLINHNLLEVNGQNVVGLKDNEITKIIDNGEDIITITIIPTFIYSHMVKNMSNSLMKKLMDHSIPEI